MLAVLHFVRCVLHDAYTEISAMQRATSLRFDGSTLQRPAAVGGTCRVLDFGVTDENYWIVMEQCWSSVRAWRLSCMQEGLSLHQVLPHMLEMFRQVLWVLWPPFTLMLLAPAAQC